MSTTAQTTAAGAPRPAPVPRNGIDTPTIFATIEAVKQQPELARFEFRATTRWVNGSHSRTTLDSFTGAGGEHAHDKVFVLDADHPAVLAGPDNGPTPIEIVLNALGSCLVAGVASVAAARRIDLQEVTAKMEGKIDMRGVLGMNNEVRNGYESIRVSFDVKGDAPAEKLRALVEQSRKRSAVYDIITNAVPVEIVMQQAD
jgi:uncharacterized OsmC-like protein